jgi:hypothetical protein
MLESLPAPPSWSLGQWLGVMAGTGTIALSAAVGYRASQQWLDRQSPQRRKWYSIGALATASVAAHVAVLCCLPQPPKFPGHRDGQGRAFSEQTVAWLETAPNNATTEPNLENVDQPSDESDRLQPASPESLAGQADRNAPLLPTLSRGLTPTADGQSALPIASSELVPADVTALAPTTFEKPPSPLADSSIAAIDRQLQSLLQPPPELLEPAVVTGEAPIAPATPVETPSVPQASWAPDQAIAANVAPARDTSNVPAEFQGRFGAAKQQALAQGGGDVRTEASVAAALAYLARVQSADGSWDPTLTGAGRETYALGQDRQGAGRTATTGITGLALLAFLGAGHTHIDGNYTDVVGRGLAALLNRQAADGSLAGLANVSEAMYCHGIATLAVCEAYALTRDARLKPAAEAAIAYTLRSQHPVTGGWRYRPGDQGDTSQLGWQALALHSGRLSGLPVTQAAWRGILAFLNSVARGPARGLACYRPIDAPSRTMTAEALAVRLLLDVPVAPAAQAEAENYLREELPGTTAIDNYYYWYYAALALHGSQSTLWPTWNQAMQQRLLSTQLQTPDALNGSWPVSELWGGYGGTVYTTAMAALCLEVYYRHLPIHQAGAMLARQPGSASR